MFSTPTERTAAVTTDLEAGAVLLAGSAAATAVAVATLLLTASAAVLMLMTTAVEALAVLGVLVWVVAFLVLVASDVSRAVHRRHTHQHGRKPQRRLSHHHWGARR